MSVEWLSSVYDWKAGIALIVMVVALGKFGRWLVFKVPAFQGVREQNRALDKERLGRDKYPPMIKRSIRAGMWTNLAFFFVMAPLVVSFEPRPLWRGLFDIVLILMVYDFFYYLTHRFLFHAAHDSRFAVLRFFRRVHAVHHQARDPSHIDAFYVHPVETTIGQLLFHFTVLGLGLAVGGFHVVSVAIASLVYIQLNTFNHVKFELPGYKVLNWISFKHHVHHIDMQKGNYATITLLYDKLFGTLD
ncbi:MAG: sterol desaturase family protein [Gammaproteobacteria bacterium]|jgi:sterol desaturase/sphingolipid hydroxylase (fatty acid hydroxylase superfamily)|nr:sterol desaturase family protein [Gammaproteobacteria bacterium]MBK8992460.1 sterol desaturase family protein [Gammaproteobacteria bacterium]MBK9467973.1 sterol desaturase family protein [Gammaproteobacteria bacterium]MBP6480314.1 sterol desaturase family protein [Pseudomonadales bacterium]MBP7910218.1 sterol desaturase family protein [Pseudomonadales bacterium]